MRSSNMTQPLKGRGRTNVVSVLQLLSLELLRAEDEFRGPALRLCWGNSQEQKIKITRTIAAVFYLTNLIRITACKSPLYDALTS
jgi:hypothetical protein